MDASNPGAILGTARQFMDSRVLLSGAQLDLFSLLADEPLTAEEVTARRGADLRAMTMLLDVLAAEGLLVKHDGRYRSTDEAARFLSADSPESVLPMVLHSADMWERWSRLTEVVRGPSASEPLPHASMNAFIGAMNVVGAPLAPVIVRAVNPGKQRRLLDVGGASGTYTLAFLQASPEMRATLFDRPQVVPLARERLGAAGVLDRVTLVGGDMMSGTLPGGHDLVFLSAIIHQNSLEQNEALYANCFQALLSGGRIVIRDHVMSPDRTEPLSGAMFAINMLAAGNQGGTFTFDEIREGLEKAGFERVRLLQTDERMDGLVEAFRP